MTERMAWRRAVRSSRLPASVRLTLLTHSEPGQGHWHDDETNEHAFPRAVLADRLGCDQSTIRRHYRRAETAGFLVMHEKGQSGQPSGQGRGHQTVFHYVTPSDPWPCEVCGMGGTKGGNEGRQIGGSNYPLPASDSTDRNASPSSTPSEEPEGFAVWWETYPPTNYPQARDKVAAAYAAALVEVGPAVLLDALRRMLPKYLADGPQFVPAPVNWLARKTWETAPPARREVEQVTETSWIRSTAAETRRIQAEFDAQRPAGAGSGWRVLPASAP